MREGEEGESKAEMEGAVAVDECKAWLDSEPLCMSGVASETDQTMQRFSSPTGRE